MKNTATNSFSNNFFIGDALSSNKYIYATTPGSFQSNPGIRYNTSYNYFEKSDDGYNWQKIIGDNDFSPITINYINTNINVYETAATTISNTINTITFYKIYNTIRRPSDGYCHVSICNFGITSLNNSYRFVGYDNSVTSLTATSSKISQFNDSNSSVKFLLDGYYGTLSFQYSCDAYSSTCKSIVIPVVTQNQITTTALRPADWWNGKTCSEWSYTQSQLQYAQNQGLGNQQVYSYSVGGSPITTVGYAYVGGVLTQNNKIYMVPADQGTQSTWHYIDTLTKSIVSYSPGVTTVTFAYRGGVLTPDGKIYLIPSAQATQSTWHYINTNTNAVVGYAPGVTGLNNAYAGGVLAPNGRIYLVPFAQATQSTWHYINSSTGAVVGYSPGVTAVDSAYNGGVLSPDGRIYLIPSNQATQSTWHYIDTNTNTVVGYVHGATGLTNNAYIGGSLAPNGRIYMAPYNQSDQSTWHYIDTNTGSIVAYTNNSGVTPVNGGYGRSAISSDGKIYFCPGIQANQSKWHYIDTNTGNVVAYNHGITVASSIAEPYRGAVLDTNGRIYLIPTTQASQTTIWHYIETNSNFNLNKGICTNPMFNKY